MKGIGGYTLSPAAAEAERRRQLAPSGLTTIKNSASVAVISGDGDVFEWFGGGAKAAGVNVTPETAMRCSTLYRCVTLIAGRMMTAPLCVYERTPNAPIRLNDHELTGILQHETDDNTSAAEHTEMQALAMMLRGNGYAKMATGPRGSVSGLEYFHPAAVQPFWSGKSAWYRFTDREGKQEILDATRVLHFRGPGRAADGIRALTTVQNHAQSVGIAIAARDYTAKQFENGLLTNEYFSFEDGISDEQRAAFKEYLRKRHSGVAGAHNPLLLEKGGEWKRLGVSAKDAQLLELLQFSGLDIATLYGVPPHLAGHADKSSNWGTGLEQQDIGFDSYTLLPHRTRIASEYTRKFFPTPNRELPKYFIAFDPQAQLRTDMKSRGEFAKTALGGNQLPGFKTQNEVRQSFGLSPVEGGDEIYWPDGGDAQPEPDPPSPEPLTPPEPETD